jgi:SAM-dependent methyltransferase
MNERILTREEEVWRVYDPIEQRLTAGLSSRMCALAGLTPGMDVLDLATGRGEPAICAAHCVGPAGRVLGIDMSEAMLGMARERAEREHVDNLEFRVARADQLTALPKQHFHATLARWAFMYFDAPALALSAAHQAMLPGALLVAALWAEPARVPYFSLPRRVLAEYTHVPEVNCELPGTFYYAESGRFERDALAAGFSIEHSEELAVDVMEARTDAELVAWARTFGMNRLLEGLPDATQRDWERGLVQGAKAYARDGMIRLGGVTRLVVVAAR